MGSSSDPPPPPDIKEESQKSVEADLGTLALRRAAELDNPDHARILCYTNRCLEELVPLARRAIHGDMADQLPVLPGEVLITRSAVMAPACRATSRPLWTTMSMRSCDSDSMIS